MIKLFTKYSRINVIATIVIFLVSGAAFFFTLNYVLINQIDQDLEIEEGEITTYVKMHDRLPESISVQDQIINYAPAREKIKRHFTTSFIVDPEAKNKERFRQLIFGVVADGQSYEAKVSKSLEDTESLVYSILLITSITILAILIASFILNRVVLKRIWRPFYQSLEAVKEFKVSKDHSPKFPATGIEEFEFMNRTLERITKQAHVDYLSLKTFSENASHEIQTPIAIIRSKLDLMIQDEKLTEHQSQTLQGAYNAAQKLARINQSLLLLAKIENNQYEETETIDLGNKLEEKLSDFQELWQAQQIIVSASLQNTVIKMNNDLAEILLNNLLSNATKHNLPGGSIDIELHDFTLRITNSSPSGALDGKDLYHRFFKSSQGNEQTGLGLSLIKQICDSSGFRISYSFRGEKHTFVISLKG
jgi:signal transduction histidine kinase